MTVGGDYGILPETHPADVGLVHVGAQPDVIQVGDRHHRRAGHHHFAEFRLPHGNHAVEWRRQGGVAVNDARQRKRLLAAFHAGLGHLDIAIGHGLEGAVALERCRCLLEHGIGLVQRRRGEEPLFAQCKVATVVQVSLAQFGFVDSNRPARGFEALAGCIQLPLLKSKAGLGDQDLLAVVGIVNRGKQGSLFYPLALVERQLDNARLHGLEAEHAFMRFDVAGQEERIVVARGVQPGEDRLAERRAGDPGKHRRNHNRKDDFSSRVHLR